MGDERDSPGWFLVRRIVGGERLAEKLSGPVEVARFRGFPEANADRRRREREARAGVNPFELRQRCLAAITSLESDILADWLLDAGIDPPLPEPDGTRHWHLWWDARMPDLHEQVWPALDRLRFFDVVELPAEPRRVYLVQEVGWRYNDEWVVTGPEARRAVEAFTSRERAENRRDELQRQNRAPHGGHTFFVWEGVAGFRDGAGDYREAPFYEVVEVDLEGG